MKRYHSINKKKIRGWKRRIRQIDAWGEWIKQPYLNYFDKAGDYTYHRCILYPFYTLEKRQPPLWFCKLIVAKFIATYYEWESVFDSMNTPYDLQLWVYDPNFMWSEIICYRVEKQGDKARYNWENETQKAFPFDKFANKNTSLEKFEWLLTDEEIVYFESELEDEDFTLDDLLADGYKKHDSGKNGFYYAKRIGDMWVGRKKI